MTCRLLFFVCWGLFAAQCFVDALCGKLARTHRGDDGCGACYRVTAGINAVPGGEAVFVDDDAAPLVDFKTFCRVLDQRVGRSADRHDDGIHIDREFASLDRYRSASAFFIRLAELHLDALHACDKSVLFIAGIVRVVVSEDLDRIVQQKEFNAFLLCVFNFLFSCRKFCHGAAVYDIDLLCAKTKGGSRRIHRDVSAADHSDSAAFHDRGYRIIEIGLHQIGTGEEFIGGVNALERFARNVHEVGETCAGTDEHRFIAHIKQFIDRQGLADDDVGFHIDAEFLQGLDFLGDDCLGKTEFGNTVDKDTSCLMQCFIDGDFISFFRKIACAGKSARTGADNSDLMSVGFRLLCRSGVVGIVPVCDKALDTADADRLEFDAEGALAFTLAFLRADTSADCRKGRGLCDDLVGFFKIAFLYLFEKIRNVKSACLQGMFV